MSTRQNYSRNQGYNQRNQGGNFEQRGYNDRNQAPRNYGGQQFHDRGDNRNPGGFSGRGRGRGGSNIGRGGYRGPSKPHVLSGEGAIFPINVTPGSIAYRYDVDMRYETKNRKGELIIEKLTDGKRDYRTRQLCYAILSVVMEHTNNFGSPGVQVAYDNQKVMYASTKFPSVIENVAKDDLPDEFAEMIHGDGVIDVTISPNEEMPKVNLADYTQYEARELLLTEDQTVRQVLEIILSQGPIDSGEYNVFAGGQLYKKKIDLLGRGFGTRIGTQKGVRMVDIETKDDRGQIVKSIKPALVVDIKKSPFYCSGNFLTNVLEFIQGSRGGNDWAEAEKAFKGVKVSPLYQKSRTLRFTSFTKQPISQISITLESGETISLVEFYAKQKKCFITRPDLPAATCSNSGDFPLEFLTILPNQRVDMQYIPSNIRDCVHKLNAVDPQPRYDNIMKEVHDLDLNNDVTKGFGISVDAEPSKATILCFDRPEKPSIKLGGGQIIHPDDDGRFNIGKSVYYTPAKVGKWVVLFPQAIDGQMIKQFIDKLIEEAKKRGITFQFPPQPDRFTIDSRNLKFLDWDKKFREYKEKGVEYVMYVDKRTDVLSHKILKLVESLHKIITQHVTEEIVKKVVDLNQNITLGNVLLKFNIKNGGTNYVPLFSAAARRLDINTGNVLIIGYDVSHPTGISPYERERRTEEGFESETKDPSIVGITANCAAEPSAFVGDFFYQATRKESLSETELRTRIKAMLTQIQKERKGKLPEIVVVLRDGVSEGQFRMACEEELPALKRGCFDFSQTYKPKFIFIITTKRHHKRFFEGEGGKFDNPMAGSFVDDKFVRPDCMEFFMACHKAIKGTAKFVQVSVVENELNATKDEIKHFLHSLCYGHQIVTSPTSLPTPIYIADELATRGNEIYRALKEDTPNFIPWKDINIVREVRKGEEKVKEKMKDREINYLALTHMLNYAGSKLANIRFNA